MEALISPRPVTFTARARFHQRARPSVPEQRPPSHMTKPTLSGTFRGSPGQPGTFQPACLQGRGRAHRLAAVPGPPPEAHEATACPHHGPGGSRNRPPDWKAGLFHLSPGGLWVPAEGSTAPRACSPCLLPVPHMASCTPPKPPEPARALHPPRRDPNPRPTLWTAPDSDSCRPLPLSRASRLHSCSLGASGSQSWEGIRKGVGSPGLLHFQDPGVHWKERASPRLPAGGSSLDTAKLLLCKHTAHSLETRKSGWPRQHGKLARGPGAGRETPARSSSPNSSRHHNSVPSAHLMTGAIPGPGAGACLSLGEPGFHANCPSRLANRAAHFERPTCYSAPHPTAHPGSHTAPSGLSGLHCSGALTGVDSHRTCPPGRAHFTEHNVLKVHPHVRISFLPFYG